MLRKTMILLEDMLNENLLSSKQLHQILNKYYETLMILNQISQGDKEHLSVVIEGTEGFLSLLELAIFFRENDR